MDWTLPAHLRHQAGERLRPARGFVGRGGRAHADHAGDGGTLPVSECPAFRMRRASTRRRYHRLWRAVPRQHHPPERRRRAQGSCGLQCRTGTGGWTSTAPAETQNYVTRIMGNYDATRGRGTPTPLLRPRRASWRQRRTILRSSGFKPPCAGHRPPARRRTPIITRASLDARLKEIQAASPAPMTPLEDAKLREARPTRHCGAERARGLAAGPQDGCRGAGPAREAPPARPKPWRVRRMCFPRWTKPLRTPRTRTSAPARWGRLWRWRREREPIACTVLIDTIKANIGFDRLQQMREASPTAGRWVRSRCVNSTSCNPSSRISIRGRAGPSYREPEEGENPLSELAAGDDAGTRQF